MNKTLTVFSLVACLGTAVSAMEAYLDRFDYDAPNTSPITRFSLEKGAPIHNIVGLYNFYVEQDMEVFDQVIAPDMLQEARRCDAILAEMKEPVPPEIKEQVKLQNEMYFQRVIDFRKEQYRMTAREKAKKAIKILYCSRPDALPKLGGN